MKKYILTIFAVTLLLASCGEKEQEVAVTSVTLTQATAEMLIGETVQLTVTVLPSNATEKTVTWASSKQSVATVSNSGLITALAEGMSTITASCGGKSGTCQVTVSKGIVEVTSISLNKEELSLIKGQSETLVAIVNPSDATNKTVTWDSSDKGVASVDANGKVTAVAGGITAISAKAGDKQTTCSVTVTVPVESISLDQDNITLEEEQSVTLVATVKPDDATDKTVTWSSSDNQIAAVDESGKVTAIKEGSTIILAQAGDKTATCSITVKKKYISVSSVSLNKSELALIKGQSETLTATVKPDDATDKTVTWSSSNTSVASVDPNGTVQAISNGNVSIIVTSGGMQASCEVIVLDPRVSTNAIFYTTSNDVVYDPYRTDGFGAHLITSSYKDGRGFLLFDGEVTRIGEQAFLNGKQLTSIQIPNSVTGIGEYSFSHCTNLTTIQIPSSVKTIDSYAFCGCTGLTSAYIPDSVTSIGVDAFEGCKGLTSIPIPNSVMFLSGFSGCSGLISIQIPDSVITIGERAFEGCSGLTSVKIPDSVTSINNRAFSGCSGLTSIEIPNSVTTIGEYAFWNCSGLSSITCYTKTPYAIGNSAFDDTNNCPIYVPLESVDEYKVALGWCKYADRIQANPYDIYSSNVTWTCGINAYDDIATVNGIANIKALKLGTPKHIGSATVIIPMGSKSVSFYGVSWKNNPATVVVKMGDTEVYSQVLAANDGAAQIAPYTITVTDSDHYTVTLPSQFTEDTAFTITTSEGGNTRILLFGIKAQ